MNAPGGPGVKPPNTAELARTIIRKIYDLNGLLSRLLVQAAPHASAMLEAAVNNYGQIESELSGGPNKPEGESSAPPPTPAMAPGGTESAAPPPGYQAGM